MRAIALLSLGHSGSTFLALQLGLHPGLVNLGEAEIAYQFGPDEHPTPELGFCFCGKSESDCAYWSVVAKLRTEPPQQPVSVQTFRTLLGAFRQVYPDGRHTPVLVVKSLEHLACLRAVEGLELSAIHLVKDVRSYCISRIDNSTSKGQGWRQRSAFYRCAEWLEGNRRIARALAGLPTARVSYEALCLDNAGTMQALATALGLAPFPPFLSIKDSHSHALRGNRLRYQQHKWTLRYDTRWFTRSEWVLPWLLIPGLARANRRLAYSQEFDGFWYADLRPHARKRLED